MIRYLFEPAAVLILLIALSFLILIHMRGRQIPQCFVCGAQKVRPSRPIGVLDFAGSALLIRPYRCSGCLRRFHALRLFSRSAS
jgi:hypothetical protein